MEPEPGPHTCSHQRGGHLRCAVPSCPAGVAGRKYRVKIQEFGQTTFSTLVRVRAVDRWTWIPERALDAF
jgi:hypothetical protein